jgi:hypothetical protein
MDFIFLTNDIEIAGFVQDCGVDRLMVDLEINGKAERQRNRSTVISRHVIDDVARVRTVAKSAKLMVRVNPIHAGSKGEIDQVLAEGADVVMLPMFTTPAEVEEFVRIVNGRATVNLLLETPAALARLDDILEVAGIDELHVGLNDLHLGMGLRFLFEPLSGGLVDHVSQRARAAGVRFGFGGIARLGHGRLDAALILSEHFRLRSEMVILSRDFHGSAATLAALTDSIDTKEEIAKLRRYLGELDRAPTAAIQENRRVLRELVTEIVRKQDA